MSPLDVVIVGDELLVSGDRCRVDEKPVQVADYSGDSEDGVRITWLTGPKTGEQNLLYMPQAVQGKRELMLAAVIGELRDRLDDGSQVYVSGETDYVATIKLTADGLSRLLFGGR